MPPRHRSSSCISSPACPSKRPPRRWASRAQPLIDTGPTPEPGSAAPSAARGRHRPGDGIGKIRETIRASPSHCRMSPVARQRPPTNEGGDAMPVQTETLKKLFLDATEKASSTERAAFLDEACAGDEALRHCVDALLLAHDRTDH